MGSLSGKVALITGGARGQGRSHAIALAREGCDVALVDIAADIPTIRYGLATTEDLESTQEEVAKHGVRCMGGAFDVRDRVAFEAFVDEVSHELGGVDILLANHGIVGLSRVDAMSYEQWDDVVGSMLTGTFNAARLTVPHMVRRGWGRVIITSSMAGKTGVPELADYAAAKWGLIGFAKSLALEVARQNITVNAICPCMVNTPIIHNQAMYKMFRPDLETPQLEDVIEGFSTMQEQGVPWIEPEDITDTVMFLVSDRAKRITGETLSVASGQNARNAG